MVINGTHILLLSADADADRAFLRDVLEFRSVDAGHGWLIFALPPAEAAVHPINGEGQAHDGNAMAAANVYLMCDNLDTEMKRLKGKNVSFSKVETERWGRKITFRLPSGAELGLYQPTHPTAISLK
jgi:catechol 2,3-dioxygenase-like lactoylglutathione lyase family enzyme